ncbi:MAG: ClC family H(+)/Cl(-) exchange transporter [Fusobacterium sp.]|nr:ClC family H(+)/Cl(-) exchange transporter [Fusobacterium sp.]
MNSSEYTKKVEEKKQSSSLYALCILVGLGVGFIVSFYRWGLEKISHLREELFIDVSLDEPLSLLKVWGIFIFIGFIVDFLYRKYPRTSGSGIPQVKGLITKEIDYKNWFQELIGKFIGGVLGIGAGLSLGREGPSVQLGSYFGYGISKIFKRNLKDRDYLITSGASAGLAGAFGAPMSGVIFSIEELHKNINEKLLVCVFISSILADFVGRRVFGVQTAFDISINFPLNISFYSQFLLYIFFGIIVAFFGKLFTYTLVKMQDLFNNIKVSRGLKIVSVMTTSFVLCIILPEVTGGGHHLAESLPDSKKLVWVLFFIFIVKLLFTALSYATGFAGGIFLPMLVLGAILGKIFGEVLNLFLLTGNDFTVHFIVLGMAAFFVAVVKAPITGAILILEMTGSFHLLLAIATVSVVVFYVTELINQEPIYDILYDRMKKD